MSFADLIYSDKKIDESLDELHSTVSKVKMVAMMQKEELVSQDRLIDDLNSNSDKVIVEMSYANKRVSHLKDREYGKSCCYIFLVIILIFILIVIIYLALTF